MIPITKTDTFDGLTVTARGAYGSDVWDEFTVKAKLPKEEVEANVYRVDKFAEYVIRTVALEGDLGFAWVTTASSETDTRAAYEGWRNLSRDRMIKWANLIYAANEAPLPDENTIPGNV